MKHTCETCKYCITSDSETNPFDKDSLPDNAYKYLADECCVCMLDKDWPLVVTLDNEDCFDGWDEWVSVEE